MLRVDDFPGTKPAEFWKHNLESFKLFDALLERHGVESYVLGVIPKYVGYEELAWLACNPRVEVALHGVEHDERFLNEFREYETEDGIFEKLTTATKKISLGSRGPIRTYIPPHNVIDMKTCLALHRVGFRQVMTGPGTDPAILEIARKNPSYLRFVDSPHPMWYGRSDELFPGRQKMCENFLKRRGDACLTLHWTWEHNIGLRHLDRYLKEVGWIFRMNRSGDL